MSTVFPRRLLAFLFLAAGPFASLPLHAQYGVGSADPAPAVSNGGFVHAVYFWLDPNLSAEQREAFVGGLRSLRGIESVQHGWIGVPADTDREIIERSYSYALTLAFADEAGHEAYQTHPVHDRFREDFGEGYWTHLVIYDSVE